MNHLCRVHMMPEARDDLRAIRAYIAKELQEPKTAQKVYTNLKTAIRSLDKMPERCPPYLEEPWHTYGFRTLLEGNHLIFFLVEKNTVHVIRVLYAGMDTSQHLN